MVELQLSSPTNSWEKEVRGVVDLTEGGYSMWGFGQMNMPDSSLMNSASPILNNGAMLSHTGQQDANNMQAQLNVPAGYTLVPMAYLQQMQMTISQMYSQVSALTTAQNALQQTFQTFMAQRNPAPLNQGANLSDLINELKAEKQRASFKVHFHIM